MPAVLVLATVLLASAVSAWAAPLPSAAGNAPDAAPSLALPDSDQPQAPASSALQFHESRGAIGPGGMISRLPILAASPAELHYQPDAYTLTHFDPTNLKVFGGLLGGNRVKDGTGAVVSLTWPIER